LQLRGFDEWFAKATSRDVEQRFASAQELVSALRDVVTGSGGVHGFAPPTAVAAHVPAPATVPGHGPSVPAGTGGHYGAAPHPATGSAPSLNTAQALELSTRGTGRSALPWVLLGAVITLGVVGAAVMLMRPKTEGPADAAASGVSVAAAAPAPADSPSVALAPAPESSPEGDSAHPPKPVAARKAGPVPASPAPASPDKPAASPPASPPPAAKTARCFSDPFSGQVRLVSGARPADTPTFACKQDPFTGKWKTQ
jgi:hypothetical protein